MPPAEAEGSRKSVFEQDFEDQSLRVLYRKMRKTAKARFNCARRYKRHLAYSLWILPLFSAGLILMPLLTILKIPVNFDEKYFNLLQIGLALLVLVISLVLSSNNYSERAEKMHRCGLELNALSKSILPHCKSDDLALYHDISDKYSTILASYENHEEIDADLAKLEPETGYHLTAGQKTLIRARYLLDFWLYGAVLLILIVAFAGLLVHAK